MRVTLLGTGCPVASTRRAGAATLIEAGGTRLLVDCGSGVAQRLVEAGIGPAGFDALLVTHLHTDHLVDLWQLAVSGWHQGRKDPLRVLGAAPVLAHARAIEAAWAEESRLRIAFEHRPNPQGLALRLEEIGAGQRLAIGAIEIEVVPVDHEPVRPAFGFVFRAGGRQVVVSGDTRPCQAIADAARGADLLVHEVFVHAAMPVRPGIRSAETVAAVQSYHSLPEQVGRLAGEAGVKALALTHIVPPDADPAMILAAVRQEFTGPVLVGEDLMLIDAEARCVGWRGMVLGLDTRPHG